MRWKGREDAKKRMGRCSPGQFTCGSTTDPTGSTGDDSDAAGVYDGMVFVVYRGDEGFDAEGRGRGTQWRRAAISAVSHGHDEE